MTPIATVDLRPTVGALQIGSVFSVFLFGFETVQAELYFRRFPEDKWHLKALVGAIWCLELAHVICVAYEVYHSTITLYGHPEELVRFPTLAAVTAVSGFIAFLSQIFYSMRVWKVLPNPWRYIGAIILVAAVARCIGSVILAVQAVHGKSIIEYKKNLGWLILVLLASGAAIDIAIALSMLYYLVKKRNQALKRVASLIDRLVAITIRSGLMTSLGALTLMITFLASPDTMIWLAVFMVLARLYANTLLATLNARKRMREQLTDSTVEVFSNGRATGLRRENFDPSRSGAAISIEMKTTTEMVSDEPKVYLGTVASEKSTER